MAPNQVNISGSSPNTLYPNNDAQIKLKKVKGWINVKSTNLYE